MSRTHSPFLPLTLVSAGILTLMISEIRLLGERAALLRQERDSRSQLVEQSQAAQRKIESLLGGLLDLAASGDPAARAIVEKHRIERVSKTNPAGTAPAPPASPSPQP